MQTISTATTTKGSNVTESSDANSPTEIPPSNTVDAGTLETASEMEQNPQDLSTLTPETAAPIQDSTTANPETTIVDTTTTESEPDPWLADPDPEFIEPEEAVG